MSDHVPSEFQQLFRQARQGDDDALGRLLERFGPAARASLEIAPKWQGEIDPDDVMQVTYIDAFLRIGSCIAPHEGAFAGWLAQIARHNLLDAIRGLEADKRPPPTRRIELGVNGDDYAHLWGLLGATTTTPSRVVSSDEMRLLITNALERLPADYATVIRLLDLESRSVTETAQEMGRTRAAVHMMAGRARDRLREVLGGATKYFSS